MKIAGVINRWSQQLCHIEGVLPSKCGKSLKLSMGSIAPSGRIQLLLPALIPAYNFLTTIDAFCPGLDWKPEHLRIAVVRCFAVVNDRSHRIGEIFQASAYDQTTGRPSGEATDWWYATVEGRVKGSAPCPSRDTSTQFDLALRRGWNAVQRQMAIPGPERCRTVPWPVDLPWFFHPF